MNLFRFLYRLQSARHPFRDYGLPGSFFVTICTKFRLPYFGTITDGRMDLSPVGKIAAFELSKTMKIRDNVVFDTWVIMPNHIHAIIRILPASGVVGVETHRDASLRKNRFGPQSDNLPAIVRGFKSAVKKWTNLYGLDFRWQSRYHDHFVRNDGELERIRWYVRNNARVWGSDSLNR
jgi:putative transposase